MIELKIVEQEQTLPPVVVDGMVNGVLNLQTIGDTIVYRAAYPSMAVGDTLSFSVIRYTDDDKAAGTYYSFTRINQVAELTLSLPKSDLAGYPRAVFTYSVAPAAGGAQSIGTPLLVKLEN